MKDLKKNFYFKQFIRALKECGLYNNHNVNLVYKVFDEYAIHLLPSSISCRLMRLDGSPLITDDYKNIENTYLNLIMERYVNDISIVVEWHYGKMVADRIDKALMSRKIRGCCLYSYLGSIDCQHSIEDDIFEYCLK